MNVQQIIDRIQLIYPNAWTSEEIITSINQLQGRIFRTISRRTTATEYEILDGLEYYPLPAPQDQIISVVVNNAEIPSRQIKADNMDVFYYFTDGYIGIYPTPTNDGTMTVFHYQVPATLTSTTDIPSLDDNYHMLLVYGVSSEIAKSNRDDRAGFFTAEYKELEMEFLKVNDDTPDYNVIQNVMGVIW